MIYLGCHLSVSGGFEKMGKDALKLGADTLQFFTRNPRGANAKKIDENDTKAFVNLMQQNNFGKIIAHAPYTLNPCSADENTRNFALKIFKDDLSRMEYIPNNYYNFHPGSHTGQGVDIGINQIADMLNKSLTENQSTIVLLETMAGKGTEIGRSFQELQAIIDKVELKNKIGVCLDTCHIFDAGYDIVNNLDGVLKEFNSVIGLDRLKAIHLNDSKNAMGSHKDRHETIGNGNIGLSAMFKIVNHPLLQGLPFCLETPNDADGYKKEIQMLRENINS
ncbi:MAG: deoxyribonuclease IV [Ruminococcus sp.]|nr:deoxyribonuclease IV [Ruminococcus sp.]